MTFYSTVLAEDAAARSGVYRLLGRLWLREADRNVLQELNSPRLRYSFLQAGGMLPAHDDNQTIEALELDYCRLFIGPMDHLPPFQSVWESGQLQSAATASMKSFIDVAGHDNGPLPDGMMPDHLGVQLDVLGHILGQVPTWHSKAQGLDQVLELANSFFRRHLQWPTDLLEAAMQRAETDFYRSLMVLTGEFLRLELSACPAE